MSGTVVGPIGTLGAVDSLTIAGRVFTDLGNLIQLYAITSNAARYASPTLYSSATGYTPSGSKKFECWAAQLINHQASNDAAGIQLGYGDTDLGTLGAGPAVNGVYIGGGNLSSTVNWVPCQATGLYSMPISFEIPNGKYGVVYNGTAGINAAIILYGYEV